VLPFLLSVANKPYMLSVIMMNVVMVSVVMMNVVMASVVMMNVVVLNDVLPPTKLYFTHFLLWQQWQWGGGDENP
jgi:type II secretory pathway component PulC